MVPRTHIEWLTTACNSSSRIYWPWQVPVLKSTHLHTDKHILPHVESGTAKQRWRLTAHVQAVTSPEERLRAVVTERRRNRDEMLI